MFNIKYSELWIVIILTSFVIMVTEVLQLILGQQKLTSVITLSLVAGTCLSFFIKKNSDSLKKYERYFKLFLQIGLVLSGFRFGINEFNFVSIGFFLPILGTLTVMLIGFLIIIRFTKSEMSYYPLIWSGFSICGISAILSLAESLRSKKEDVFLATTMISLVGLVSVFVLPDLAHFFFAQQPVKAGTYLGLLIPDTAQVVAGAYQYVYRFNEEEVTTFAILSKLIRNLSLPLFIILSPLVLNRSSKSIEKKSIYPMFIYLYLGAILLRLLIDYLGISGAIKGFDAMFSDVFDVLESASVYLFSLSVMAMGLVFNLAWFKMLEIKSMLIVFGTLILLYAVATSLVYWV